MSHRTLAVGILVILFGIPTVTWSGEVPGEVTDFDADGDSDLDDLNLLLALGPLVDGYIVEPGALDPFDLNGDGFVDKLDARQWLADAAKVNAFAWIHIMAAGGGDQCAEAVPVEHFGFFQHFGTVGLVTMLQHHHRPVLRSDIPPL